MSKVRSVRAMESRWNAWQEAADARGMTLNAWLAQAADERAQLEKVLREQDAK